MISELNTPLTSYITERLLTNAGIFNCLEFLMSDCQNYCIIFCSDYLKVS